MIEISDIFSKKIKPLSKIWRISCEDVADDDDDGGDAKNNAVPS